MAGKTASRFSLIALGFPGRLRIKVLPLIPATCLERIAVGTYWRDAVLICSPKPGSIFSQTASVASGVTSRKAGPVPPVVMTRLQFLASAISMRVDWITSCSSGITAYSTSNEVVSHVLRSSTQAFPGMSS